MARIARVVVPNHPHHITQRGSRRQPTFFCSEDYQLYIDLCAEFSKKYGVEIWAYCLMPNHVHLVAVPENDKSLSQCFSRLHHKYAYLINKRNEWQGHLWQQRFFSCVMDENHLLATVRYIELNPVRAKICSSPTDWLWSSASAHSNGISNPLLAVKPMLDRVDNWAEYLGQKDNKSDIESIRKHTRTGRPVGSETFVESISKFTGRKLVKSKPGPKVK